MKVPAVTLSVVAMAALVAICGAEAEGALVYDRYRIADGELWRLITCNWVHFSKSHLAYDVAAFGIAGSLLEMRSHRGFGWFCLLAPGVIGASVFVTCPNLMIFGGLSGLATGAIVLLATHGLREPGPWRCICLLALAAVAMKTAMELLTRDTVFMRGGGLRAAPEAHIAGSVVALMISFRLFLQRNASNLCLSTFIFKNVRRYRRRCSDVGRVLASARTRREEGPANGVRRHVQFPAA